MPAPTTTKRDEAGIMWNCLPGNGVSKTSRGRVPRPAPVNQPSATSPPSSVPSRWSTRSPTGRSSARTRSRAAPGSTRARSRACSRRSPRRGFVEHVPETGRYRLSLRLVELGNAVLGRLDLRALARPHLQALVRETGETATLSAPGEHDAVTVDFAHSSSVVQSVAQLGRPSVGHATAAGKVMLAFGDVELPADPLASFTPRTIATPGGARRGARAGSPARVCRGAGGARGRSRRGRGAGVRQPWRPRRHRRRAGPGGAVRRAGRCGRRCRCCSATPLRSPRELGALQRAERVRQAARRGRPRARGSASSASRRCAA